MEAFNRGRVWVAVGELEALIKYMLRLSVGGFYGACLGWVEENGFYLKEVRE